MIQRIQTVYILLSAILIGSLFSLSFAEIASNDQLFVFDIRGIIRNNTVQESGLSLALLIGLILILHIYTLFIYKKRILQIRVLVFTSILMVGLFGLFYFFTYYTFSDARINFKISAIFPLIAVVLDYLAIRSIRKDETLIRSIDRIR